MSVQVANFAQSRVLVFGDLMLDRYWHGPTSRISPEAPVPVVKITDTEERAGGAGNVALNIASLGGKVDILGLVGNDEPALVLHKMLTEAGATCSFQQVEDLPTITKLRILSRNQQLIRLDFEESFGEQDTTELQSSYRNKLTEAGAVILSDYDKGALTDPQTLIKAARTANIPVLIDPKGTDFSIYRGASLITPNLSEFEAVVGPCTDEADLVKKGLQLIEDVQLDALLVTRSEKGMTLLQRGQAPLHLPAHAREVYDVTGAGDTVISILAAALAAGNSLENATRLSNIASGIVVGKLGTATVNIAELRRAVLAETATESDILSEEQMLMTIEDARAHGERIVLTNGCFDILHPGHVAYLKHAKKLGDRLIVAVNSDASVSRLKGPERPINHLQHRMEVLAGLESVDWVVPFEEDTPERIITKLLPDLLVKGGDYKAEDVAGGSSVIKNGGAVQILNFEDGYSTSNIINSIKATD